MRCLIVPTLTLLILGCSAAGDHAPSSAHLNIEQGRASAAFASIGAVVYGGNVVCTAVLVSPTRALAAAHCFSMAFRARSSNRPSSHSATTCKMPSSPASSPRSTFTRTTSPLDGHASTTLPCSRCLQPSTTLIRWCCTLELSTRSSSDPSSWWAMEPNTSRLTLRVDCRPGCSSASAGRGARQRVEEALDALSPRSRPRVLGRRWRTSARSDRRKMAARRAKRGSWRRYRRLRLPQRRLHHPHRSQRGLAQACRPARRSSRPSLQQRWVLRWRLPRRFGL
jgi:hypothetical protein